MSETKDYSLLRPFDEEAAKRGEAILANDGTERDFLDGPDFYGRIAVKEPRPNGTYCFQFGPATAYRMAPLCWVEDRPVYRGDVLWWKPESRRVVVSNFDGDKNCPLIGEDRCFYVVENLTWTLPNVKRDGWVNIYPAIEAVAVLSDAWPTKKQADELKRPDRIACVRIEWEEPAEVAK